MNIIDKIIKKYKKILKYRNKKEKFDSISILMLALVLIVIFIPEPFIQIWENIVDWLTVFTSSVFQYNNYFNLSIFEYLTICLLMFILYTLISIYRILVSIKKNQNEN